MKLDYVDQRFAWRSGLCSVKKCKVETWRLQNPWGWRKALPLSSNQVSHDRHVESGRGSATGFLAPGFFKSGASMSLRSNWQFSPVSWNCLREDLDKPTKPNRSCSWSMRWGDFWGLIQKRGNQLALCSVLAVHQLGDVFEKASSSWVPHWNKWK